MLEQETNKAHLIISSFDGVEEKAIPVSNDSNDYIENISDLQKGIHHVSLFVNGTIVDSTNFIKR